MTIALIGLLLLAASDETHGTTTQVIYVNNRSGDDRFNGRSPERQPNGSGPLKSINAAIRQSSHGGRIVVVPTDSPYDEQVVVHGARLHGFSSQPLVIDGGGATISGRRSFHPDSWDRIAPGSFVRHGSRDSSGTLIIDGKLQEPVPNPINGAKPAINPGEHAFWFGRYYLRLEPETDISKLDIDECRRGAGMAIIHASHVTVRNFAFDGFGFDGAQVYGPAEAVIFKDCKFLDNADSGLTVRNDASVVLDNCQIAGNGASGLNVLNFSDVDLADSAFEENLVNRSVDATSRIKDLGGEFDAKAAASAGSPKKPRAKPSAPAATSPPAKAAPVKPKASSLFD
ncbi:hypothetical protein Pan216_40560 [Planctomycetes bacterium Pan216]|uniref:Right handed beta helix domain-containing protein n=1 Tax=Kolteria novifilia TaxID=2527975 RepID=A0A518B879_9BACT|nr:hypothetical protein Pan216_40560 [Planctomycetes bacterium Pan216]